MCSIVSMDGESCIIVECNNSIGWLGRLKRADVTG